MADTHYPDTLLVCKLGDEPKPDRVAALYGNQGMHSNAAFIAAIAPRAFDYL